MAFHENFILRFVKERRIKRKLRRIIKEKLLRVRSDDGFFSERMLRTVLGEGYAIAFERSWRKNQGHYLADLPKKIEGK